MRRIDSGRGRLWCPVVFIAGAPKGHSNLPSTAIWCFLIVAMLQAAQARGGFVNASFSKPDSNFATPGASASGTNFFSASETQLVFFSSAEAEAEAFLPEGKTSASATARWPNTTSINWSAGAQVIGPGRIIFNGNGSGRTVSEGISGTSANQGNGGEVQFGKNGPTMTFLGEFIDGTIHLEINVPPGTWTFVVTDHTRADATATAGSDIPHATATADATTNWSAVFVPEPSSLALVGIGAICFAIFARHARYKRR